MLTAWWIRLEAAHRFGGPRRYLHDLLGAELAGFLETAGVLRQSGIAPSYPCEERRGEHCPRTVVEIDGAYHAVCGNRPAGCRDLVLTEHEAALLCIDMPGLCRILASALSIRARPESVRDLIGVHLVGFFMPEPGIRYPVYLVARARVLKATPMRSVRWSLARTGGPFLRSSRQVGSSPTTSNARCGPTARC